MKRNSIDLKKLEQAQQEWIKTFGFQSIDDDYIPNLPKEIEPLFEGGIHLKGSFNKLLKRNRLEHIQHIKPTLENPDALIKQNNGAFIFIKDFGEEQFFSSVARNDKNEWIVVSNAPKRENNIVNKVKLGGEVIFNELISELPIIARLDLNLKALNEMRLEQFSQSDHSDKSILPQKLTTRRKR